MVTWMSSSTIVSDVRRETGGAPSAVRKARNVATSRMTNTR